MDLKIIIKKLLLDRSNYAQATLNINKQIKECVDMLDSIDLKINADKSLRVFASKLLNEGLLAMGINQNQMLLAIGSYRTGQNTMQIVRKLSSAPLDATKLKGINKILTDEAKTEFVEDRRYSKEFATGELPVKNVGQLGVANNEYGKIYMERVKEALNRLTDSEAKYDSHVSLRNIAEMTVRYETTLKKLDDLKAKGVNFIVTSRHENCSKRCEKWQGGHYTLDNTYKTLDGIQFIPLSVATDQYVTTKSGKTYKNGHLTGYNCRHYAIPYQKGFEPPMVDKATILRQRKIDQRMRELERLVRRWKEKVAMLEGTPFTKELKDAKIKVRYWKAQYETFCRENRRAIEPSRIQIF